MTVEHLSQLSLQEFIASLHLSIDDQNMLNYNLQGGKFLRLSFFRRSLSLLLPNEPPAFYDKAGWCIELLQAYFLINDDIIDNSEIRRGHPAWYKMHGLSAISDSITIRRLIYLTLQEFKTHVNFFEILKLFNFTECITWYGQCLDDLPKSLCDYTEESYRDQVLTKTTNYTFVLPVKLAHLLAMKEYLPVCDGIMCDVGFLFQFQDDYLNYFPEKANKSGTDLEEKKVTWFIIELLKDGKKDMVEKYLMSGDYGEVRKEIEKYLNRYEEIINGLRNDIIVRCEGEQMQFVVNIVDVLVKRNS